MLEGRLLTMLWVLLEQSSQRTTVSSNVECQCESLVKCDKRRTYVFGVGEFEKVASGADFGLVVTCMWSGCASVAKKAWQGGCPCQRNGKGGAIIPVFYTRQPINSHEKWRVTPAGIIALQNSLRNASIGFFNRRGWVLKGLFMTDKGW